MQHVTSVFTHISDYCAFSVVQPSNLWNVTFEPQAVHPFSIAVVIRAKYVFFSLHCKTSFGFKVIVVTNSYSVKITRMILRCTFLWSNEPLFKIQWVLVHVLHLSELLLSSHSRMGGQQDVWMSGGSWACGGGATKGKGHCGHSKWGNSSHHYSMSFSI